MELPVKIDIAPVFLAICLGSVVCLAYSSGTLFLASRMIQIPSFRCLLDAFPVVQCDKYMTSARPTWRYGRGIAQQISHYNTTQQAVAFVHSFFHSIPVSIERREVSDILRKSILVALSCGKMWGPLSSSAKRILDACAPLRLNIAERYPMLTKIDDEILCSAHSLRTMDPKVRKFVSDRAALDIGAFIGDSAVILIDFAKAVYSFEPGPSNFKVLVNVIAQNRNHRGIAHPVNVALSDTLGTIPFRDASSSGASFGRGGVEVNMTTVDLFVESHDLQIGFVKCDTEGHGLPILRGAERTLKKHRPVFSFAVYHTFDEFFGIPSLLTAWLPNYEFWWEFGVKDLTRWHELVFAGYPREILM
jgi:FkbM family methyltransferase